MQPHSDLTPVSRRSFLAGSTAVFTAGLVPGGLGHDAFAAGTDPGLLGQGALRFRRDTAWTFKSAGSAVPVKDCHEMVRTKAGNLILCTNHTGNNLIEFTPSGEVKRAFGTTYPGAHGLTLAEENGEEFLWLTDTQRRIVVKLDMQGRELMVLGWPADTGKYPDESKFSPTETAVNPVNGDLYVADGYGSNWLIHYSAKGELKGCYRHTGFNCIHGVAYDARDAANPRLLVTSRAANKLFTLGLDGADLGHVEFPGAWICRPVIHGEHVYFAVINSGRLKWGSDFRGFVMILGKDNQPLSLVGGTPPAAGAEGEAALFRNVEPKPFFNCHDVCLDEEGNLFVAHWASNQSYPFKLVPAT
jgi:peptidylamidoglycolate lyase